MKRILLILLLIVCKTFLFGQVITTNTPGSVPRANKSIKDVEDFNLGARANLYIPRMKDTVQANESGNAPMDSCGRIIYTYRDNALWLRACSPKRWVKPGNISTFNFLTDSSMIICYNDGHCDTIGISNLYNIVTNIVQNFNDSSVFNINDSTLLICHGQGEARVCDTIHLGNSNSYYFTITGDTLITCDTIQTICPTPSTCYNQQVCDTILLNQPPPVLQFQNGVQKLPNTEIVEFGNWYAGNTLANLWHNTYLNTSYNQFIIHGTTTGYPPFALQQNQWAQLSSSIMEYHHYGAYRPDLNLLDENNVVNLRVNYTDPFVIPTQGALAGDTVGFLGGRYAYLIMTNSRGTQNHYDIDDYNAKQTGIALHTYGADLDAVTIFGNQVPSAFPFTSNPPTDTTLFDSRIAVFKTTKDIQFPGYDSSRHDGTPRNVLYVDDENGNLKMDTLSGGNVTIINDTTIVICSFGTNLCDTIIVGGGVARIYAQNGLTALNDSTVELGGTLLKNTTIDAANFILTVNKSAGSSTALVVTGNSAVGINVTGTSSNGAGIIKNTGGNIGLWASSQDATTNTILTSARIGRYSTGTAADGIGGQIEFNIQADDGSGRTSNEIKSKWVTAALATRTSQLDITGVNSASTGTIASFYGSGVVGIGISSSYTATRLNVVDNAVGGANIVNITSTSTAASGNLQKGLNVAISGANSTSGQFTYGIYSTNTHTGTTSINYAIVGDATGGASANVGVQGFSLTTSGVGVGGNGNGWGGQFQSSAGIGIEAISFGGTYAANFYGRHSSTNAINIIMALGNETTGTAADGIGGSILFNTETTNGTAEESNRMIWTWTTATHASRTSSLKFQGVLSTATVDLLTLAGDGSVKLRPISAAAASAITPAEGMLLIVNTTDATFTSTGFWGYSGGAWGKLSN